MEITRYELTYSASNGGHDIFACVWRDSDRSQYKAVIQLVHGMAEYILRYEEFAAYLARRGYIVVGNDHAGHGFSVEDDRDRGYFGKRENSWEYLIDDMNYLEDMMKLDYPDLPYFMIGHSMGSLLAREYVCAYGSGMSGAVFMGTAYSDPKLPGGILLAKYMAKKKPREKGEMLNRIAFGSYNKRIKGAETNFDWLSTDKKEVDKYINDKNSGFLFTNEGYRDLFLLTKEVNTTKWARSLPKDLPMLLISGSDDPVGDYGKGVRKVYKMMVQAGCSNVEIKLLKGARHEILNDLKKQKVYNILYNWLENNI